ncbi:THAP domain-containing protein 1 [Papilio machaon]|uniref:THAP domain-containing protein 1 n=1 Tax=Papilio machaon TaxID=76193 RepID=A0A194QSV7_PAPMA|nr:THAP domain-containing protein 1 [Papilio machaon]
MITCIFCKTQYEKGSGISLHKFPKGVILKRWLNNMKLDNFSPSDNDRLCSKHFTDECFEKHKTRTTLKRSSVPTIFYPKMRPTSSSTSFQKDDLMKDVDTLKSSKSQHSKNKGLQELKRQGAKTTSTLIEQDPLADCALRRPIKMEIEEKNNISCTCLFASCNSHQNSIPMKDMSQVCGTVKHDHCYQTNTPTSYKKAMEKMQNTLKIARQRIKALSQHVKRLRKKITTLKDTNKESMKRNEIGDAFVDLLKDGEDVKSQLFKRMFLNSVKNVSHAGYPKELKSFSLTLYALSPHAYDFVRKKFNLALPHPRMIRSWRSALSEKSGLPVENITSITASDPAEEFTSGQDGMEQSNTVHAADSPYEFNSVQDGSEHDNSETESPCEFTLVEDGMEYVNSASESSNEYTLIQAEMEHVNRDTESPCEFTLIQDGMEDDNGAIESPYKFALIQDGMEHVKNGTESYVNKFTLIRNDMKRVNASSQRKEITKRKRKKKNDLSFAVGDLIDDLVIKS